MEKEPDKLRFGSAEIEAANRAEATALLIRADYRVYRPEADIHGEDMVIRTPKTLNSELLPVQLKSRATVNKAKYGDRGIWMLFPSAPFAPDNPRQWFLVPHDKLFDYVHQRHGHTPKWNESWSYPSISKDLMAFLQPFAIAPAREDRFVMHEGDVEIIEAGNPA